MPEPSRLWGENLTLAYDQSVISRDLGISIPDNSFTVIVGPNACGKSTLLRALSRMLKPRSGHVHLDGRLISSYPSKEVARRLGLLPQSSVAPDGITVADLVARGRYPHQKLLRQWSRSDEAVISESMEATGVAELADRMVDELSGGQRQRVWLAMVLAQQTPLLLLDEPTTFLDIAHQMDVLDLCAELHHEREYTLVAVLHDLNQACRYATHLIVMKDGAVVAEGEPAEIVTADLVESVFGLPVRVVPDPETGTPMIVAIDRRGTISRRARGTEDASDSQEASGVEDGTGSPDGAVSQGGALSQDGSASQDEISPQDGAASQDGDGLQDSRQDKRQDGEDNAPILEHPRSA